ncbi:hypothetical protein ACP8YP_24045, partial [Escherichia coli]
LYITVNKNMYKKLFEIVKRSESASPPDSANRDLFRCHFVAVRFMSLIISRQDIDNGLCDI